MVVVLDVAAAEFTKAVKPSSWQYRLLCHINLQYICCKRSCIMAIYLYLYMELEQLLLLSIIFHCISMHNTKTILIIFMRCIDSILLLLHCNSLDMCFEIFSALSYWKMLAILNIKSHKYFKNVRMYTTSRITIIYVNSPTVSSD